MTECRFVRLGVSFLAALSLFCLSSMMEAGASAHRTGAIRKQLGKRHSAKKVAVRHKKSRKVIAQVPALRARKLIWTAPKDKSKVSSATKRSAKRAFAYGAAGNFSPNVLLKAGVFKEAPLLGGIFNRTQPVSHIILHSTETGLPANALRVVRSWNRGMRHPGAQYLVDRDGAIYQTVDPAYGTVHVDTFRTLSGINNDNTIGIEIVRAGKQKYTALQLESLTKLVTYLQDRFNVPDRNIVGHGQIQPSNRTDPVNFNWKKFAQSKSVLQSQSAMLGRMGPSS